MMSLRLQPVHVPAVRSLWLQEALLAEPAAERVEPLVGTHAVDVCIVGGGYTGMWTALRLLDLDPSVSVTIVEADICGGGASGRNGGMALPWWTKAHRLAQAVGDEEARWLLTEAAQAIDELEDFCATHGVDAHLRRGGALQLATTPLHLEGGNDNLAALRRLGFDGMLEEITPEAAARRGGSPVYRGGLFDPTAATVQPALLARGLRRVVAQCGVTIFEKTPVLSIEGGARVRLRTPTGEITADKVVLATNAWTAALPELRRHMIVVSSDMVATAPAPDRIRDTGWVGGEAISDLRLMVHYMQSTQDGRIAIGRGSGALAYLGRITPEFDHSPRRAATVEMGLRRLYPMLTDLPITHRWAGPIDRSRSGTLIFGRLADHPNISYGIGYSGTGVAQSLMGGKILASTVLERRDEWSESRLNQGPLALYPPDPVRFFAGLGVRAAVSHCEAEEERGIKPNPLLKTVSRIAYPYVPRSVAKANRSTR